MGFRPFPPPQHWTERHTDEPNKLRYDELYIALLNKIARQLTGSLLQLINCIRQRLLVGLDVAPDVAVALMPRSLAGIVNTFAFGKLT